MKRLGQYLAEGELICLIEDPSVLEADIELAEQSIRRIEIGQAVHLKARALPFETFETEVGRIAPSAEPGELQSTVRVTCKLESEDGSLKSGMTGHARIDRGPRRLGQIAIDRVLRYIRTEFWW